MPNKENILAPVTMLGTGRSGTTLVSKAFAAHPDFQDCGESGGLIFSVWEGARETFMPLEREYWHIVSDNDEKAAHYVRLAVVAAAPSNQPRWFHKPAGLPFQNLNWQKLPGSKSEQGVPVEWYWNVFDRSFPDAKYFTVLRNPFDIAVSRLEHTAWDLAETLGSIEQTYELLDYGWDRLAAVVEFEQLVGDFRKVMQEICRACAVEFDTAMIGAITENHAAAPGRGPVVSHKDTWHRFDGIEVPRRLIERFERIWERLGHRLEVPNGLVIR